MMRIDTCLTDAAVFQVISTSDQPLTQSQMAAIIGCSERTIHRAIKRLQVSGQIKKSARRGPYPYEYICCKSR
jgi:predicted transcriptional regulator